MCKSSDPHPLTTHENEDEGKAQQTWSLMRQFITEFTETSGALDLPLGSFLIKLLSLLSASQRASLPALGSTTHWSRFGCARAREGNAIHIHSGGAPMEMKCSCALHLSELKNNVGHHQANYQMLYAQFRPTVAINSQTWTVGPSAACFSSERDGSQT
jgi:hypothetical protein